MYVVLYLLNKFKGAVMGWKRRSMSLVFITNLVNERKIIIITICCLIPLCLPCRYLIMNSQGLIISAKINSDLVIGNLPSVHLLIHLGHLNLDTWDQALREQGSHTWDQAIRTLTNGYSLLNQARTLGTRPLGG